MYKDVGMAIDSGKPFGVPLPLTGLTQQMFQTAISKGFPDDDFCSTIKVLEELAGVVGQEILNFTEKTLAFLNFIS